MRHRAIVLFVVGTALIAIGALLPPTTHATPARQDDMLARGQYIATVASCGGCHTPYAAEYYPPDTLEKMQKISFEAESALDESMWLAGGRPFNLGPAGTIFSSNLTSDAETGLGAWTDEEIKTAITKGIRRDGSSMYPLMPYPRYAGMAESDLDALVAYLRSIEPISNLVEPPANTPPPIPTSDERPATPPDGSDPHVLGEYLTRAILNCEVCHTQVDEATGISVEGLYLAGGQPYEGPWGIVYSANITPHASGIGNWSREEITRALIAGVDNTGRHLVLMPWELYRELTPNDREAVVTYITEDVEPIDNTVPTNVLQEGFERYVGGSPAPATEEADDDEGLNLLVVIGLIVAAGLGVGGGLLAYQRRNKAKSATPNTPPQA